MSHVPPRPLVWYVTQGYAIRGGHEAHVLHFATELRDHGFDTRVLVLDELPHEEHRFMRLLRERGIDLESVRRTQGFQINMVFGLVAMLWGMWQLVRGRRPAWDVFRNYLADRFAACRLRRKLNEERPAVIHIMGRLADYAWAVLPAERCVLHHGTEGRRDGTWDVAEFEGFRDFARRAARNFAPGLGVARNVAREFQIDRPIVPVFTICPDQAAGALNSASSAARALGGTDEMIPLRFGMLCRMTPEKGIHDLLSALRLYRDRRGAVDFLLAGGGALEAEVRACVSQHALQGVRVVSTFESPVELLRTMDVFVHPSLSDAMPMAIAEALMCGLPCIVTRIGGIPDLVRDGQEGYLIEPGQPAQIVAAMERFQDMTPDGRAAFARRARARYEEVCRPDRVGAIVAGHYRQILAESGCNVPN